ncbi:MAG: methyltransferase domain-containing protein [Candidatus Shapirobacteria bacterium]|nr:methyltransferase domain-containing protein [Candidatus Shapirobacteria bacterium]
MSIYSESFTTEILNNPNSSLNKINNLIGVNTQTILDVGCSSGYFGKFIKDHKNFEVWGIEMNKDDAKEAQTLLDRVIISNLENLNWKKTFLNKRFDSLIFADVLEHLRNPQEVLTSSCSVLKENGHVYISVPNITHQSILIELINGQWNYEESGLLDKTHVHFFDYNGAISLVENSGLYIDKVDFTVADIPTDILKIFLNKKQKKNKHLIDILNQPHSKVFQFIISAMKQKPKNYVSYKNKDIIKPMEFWYKDWEMIVSKNREYQIQINDLQNKVLILNQQLTVTKTTFVSILKDLYSLFKIRLINLIKNEKR